MALVTVAIPVYSDFPWYIHSLESCFKQSDTDFEILLCINRPGDNSIDRWLDSRKPSQPVRVMRSDRVLSMAENWNRCVENSSTEWLVILHEDDELKTECIRTLNRSIRDHASATSIFGGAEIIDQNGRRVQTSLTDRVRAFVRPKSNETRAFSNEQVLNRLGWANFIYPPALCLNRKALGTLRFDSRWKFVTDLDFYVSLFSQPGHSISLPASIARYRRHEGGSTAQMTKTLHRFEEEIAFYSELSRRARERQMTNLALVSKWAPLIRINIVLNLLKTLVRLQFSNVRELCTLALKGLLIK